MLECYCKVNEQPNSETGIPEVDAVLKSPAVHTQTKDILREALKHDIMEYRVEENKPYGTWAIVELFPGGTVRSPFSAREEAIKREEEIGEYYGWKLKRVELTAEEVALLAPQRFPKRTAALGKLQGYDVIHVHDDGDLTVRSRGKFYVVTTEGQTFEQKEYLAKTIKGVS